MSSYIFPLKICYFSTHTLNISIKHKTTNQALRVMGFPLSGTTLSKRFGALLVALWHVELNTLQLLNQFPTD